MISKCNPLDKYELYKWIDDPDNIKWKEQSGKCIIPWERTMGYWTRINNISMSNSVSEILLKAALFGIDESEIDLGDEI